MGVSRPAVAEPTDRHIRIEHRGVVVADTRAAVRTLETSHPPSYYLPPPDVLLSVLRRSATRIALRMEGASGLL